MIAADNDLQFSWFSTQPRIFSHELLYGLVDQQYKSTELLQQSFTANSYFPLKTQKFSPADAFRHTVYCTFNFVTVHTPATNTVYETQLKNE